MTHVVVTHVVVALAVATATSGCVDGAVSFCEQRARAECELAFACCTSGERLASLPPYTSDEGECVERATSTCKLAFAAVDDSIALGRTTWDADDARVCLEALGRATEACDRTLAQEAHVACAGVAEGAVSGGGACASSSECRAGGVCDFAQPPGVDEELHAPDGTCIEPPTEGAECPDGLCAAGLFCNNNQCDRLPGEGDACNVECAAGLFCGSELICEKLRKDGETCARVDECISGVCAPEDDEIGALVCGGRASTTCNGL